VAERKNHTPSLSPDELIRRPPATSPWEGRSIMIRHAANQIVIATSRGKTAIGTTEAEALALLAYLIQLEESGREGDREQDGRGERGYEEGSNGADRD
jgi:hypothetical protein